jgi:ABC-type transporter Mla subunit MlaD
VALPDLNSQAANVTSILDQLSRLSSDAADILEANRPFSRKFVTEGGKTLQLLYDQRNQLPGVVRGLREFFQVLGEAAGTTPDPSSPGTTLADIKFIVGGGSVCGGGHDAQHPALACQAAGVTVPAIPGLSGAAPQSSSKGAPKQPPIALPSVTLPGPSTGVQAVNQLLGGLLR